jgi:AmiR/NasT family two-component response regulator
MKQRGTKSSLLRELRSMNVVVFHPEDQDGQEVIGQLQRIGCRVQAFWPPLDKLPADVDLVFLAVRPEVLSIDLPWLRRDGKPPVIAVVTYENPVLVEAVLALDAYGVIASPVKSFGLLTTMVVAINQAQRACEREKMLARAEQRLASQRKIAKAKAILMQSRGISEEDAYKLIRSRAMGRRVTTEEIADAVIQANEILGIKGGEG